MTNASSTCYIIYINNGGNYVITNEDQIVMMAEADDVIDKEKEHHMADYIASMKAIEDAMEHKEQKRELKSEYDRTSWLTKEDISLTVKAYRLLKMMLLHTN